MAPHQASKTGARRAIAGALVLTLARPALAFDGGSNDAGLDDPLSLSADRLILRGSDAGTPDAGPFGDPLYAQCPPIDPAQPATQQADGSWVLPPARAARQACLLVTCDERRKQLEASPPFLSQQSLIFAAIMAAAGLFLGGYLGWSVARWLPR